MKEIGSSCSSSGETTTTTKADTSLDLLGVSVHHLQTYFMERVLAAGFSKDVKVYEIENLQGPPGLIRQQGTQVISPVDGKLGASYVHCFNDAKDVGAANYMLSYSWRYVIM